jgi:hypothetical protein
VLRTLTRLGAALAGLLLVFAVQAGPASAADAAGCRIAPGTEFAFKTFCVNTKPAASYSVAFHAPAGTTGAWSITGDWTGVVGGCGAADDYCTVTTPGSGADREVQGSKGGFSSHALIRAYCGRVLC